MNTRARARPCVGLSFTLHRYPYKGVPCGSKVNRLNGELLKISRVLHHRLTFQKASVLAGR